MFADGRVEFDLEVLVLAVCWVDAVVAEDASVLFQRLCSCVPRILAVSRFPVLFSLLFDRQLFSFSPLRTVTMFTI
jgi:hypothetical protein